MYAVGESTQENAGSQCRSGMQKWLHWDLEPRVGREGWPVREEPMVAASAGHGTLQQSLQRPSDFKEVINKLSNLTLCSYIVTRFAGLRSCQVSKIILLSLISVQGECSILRVLFMENISICLLKFLKNFLTSSSPNLPPTPFTHVHILVVFSGYVG